MQPGKNLNTVLSRFCAIVLCVLVLQAPAHAAPDDADLHLILEGAVFQDRDGKRGPRTDLHLDLRRRNGAWLRDIYGLAPNLNRADHYGKIQSVMTRGVQVAMEVLIEIDTDGWIPGGLTHFDLNYTVTGFIEGTYKGTFRGVELEGKISGRVQPSLQPDESFVAPEPGEHPRLLIRNSEIPALKAKAKTEWGRKMIEKIKARTEDGVAMGLMYVLTGEQNYADLCREFLQREREDFTGGPFGVGHRHGERQLQMALTYDLAFEGLDERFCSMIAGYLSYYSSRSGLRPTRLSPKTNLAPGSNYMAFFVTGAYAAQAAIWDAPGIFPPEPAAPQIITLRGPGDFEVPEGVPIVGIDAAETIADWLYAGPFFAYKGREDSLVLKDRLFEPGSGPYYQHFGQDFMESIGGHADARPIPGTQVEYQGRTRTFAPLQKKAIVQRDGVSLIDLWVANNNVPCSVGCFYTVLDVKKGGWQRVYLDPPMPEAQKASAYLGDKYDDFPEKVPFHIDATLYISGFATHHGDAVRLDAGRYPALLRATTMQNKARVQPRLERTTEGNASNAIGLLSDRYFEAIKTWEHIAEAYYRRPLYPIMERKVQRYDKWAQGDGGYKNEAGSYHGYTMPISNMLAHVYRNMTGVTLNHNSMVLPCYVAGDIGNNRQFATGFGNVPEKMKPAVLWAWKRTEDFGEDPVWTFLNYPLDMDAKSPEGIIPRAYVDEQQGYYLFRNDWTDDAIKADIYFKSFAPTGWNRANAGSFSIHGFGHTWAWRGEERSGDRFLQENVVLFPGQPASLNGPGHVTHLVSKNNGSAIVSADLGNLLLRRKSGEGGKLLSERDYGGVFLNENHTDLGLRWRRSFAADYSGASGAPALFVVVDKTSGGKDVCWQLLTGGKNGNEYPVAVNGNTFTISRDAVSLVGTVVSPATPEIHVIEPGTKVNVVDPQGKEKALKTERRSVHITGGDVFVIVMTLQKGAPPKVQIAAPGLNWNARIGEQFVYYDGENVVFDRF